MSKNTGRPYEILTKLILQQAYEQDGVKNLRAEHDITLQGLSLTHQIDVYLTFQVGGNTYSTIVQCKDWNSAVKQEQLQTFNHVLSDLPGQPRGIFVTRKSYQAGAKKLAKDKGIILYTLREPTENELDDLGIIHQRFEINITGLHPWSSQPDIVVDEAWLRAECALIDVPKGTAIPLRFAGDERNVALYNEDKTLRQTLYEFKQTLYPVIQGEIAPQVVAHYFTEPTYMRNSDDPRFPFVRITSISYEIAVSSTTSHHVVETQADDIAAYILKDVLSGKTGLVDRELRLRIIKDEEVS